MNVGETETGVVLPIADGRPTRAAPKGAQPRADPLELRGAERAECAAADRGECTSEGSATTSVGDDDFKGATGRSSSSGGGAKWSPAGEVGDTLGGTGTSSSFLSRANSTLTSTPWPLSTGDVGDRGRRGTDTCRLRLAARSSSAGEVGDGTSVGAGNSEGEETACDLCRLDKMVDSWGVDPLIGAELGRPAEGWGGGTGKGTSWISSP
mmetsp:Transcript_67353/g.146616  ORF Transcript_67353/g.146616 Transcript_67353/m.146616 type:complete len:209 (-) Transcript_67353:340-966(-)